MEKRSFRPPEQQPSDYRLPSTRYVPVAAPPTRFVSAQMTVGLKEFYQRIDEGKQSTLVSENMEEEVFALASLGNLLAGRYKICDVLGKGQSSIMIKAEDTFHPVKKHVAIKILHTSYSGLGPQEVSCLLHIKKADTLKVSNTITILNVFSVGQHFCIVFELLKPRPLHNHFQIWSFSSKAEKIQLIRKVAFQVNQSLAVLSSLNIIHADIKPENILFQNGEETKVKIIDFGNSLYCVHDEISLYYDEFDLQTIIYRAPEVIFGLSFGPQIDMWSLGCVLAECFLGEPLFLGRTKKDILEKMKSILGLLPMYPFQSGKYFSYLKQFVGRMSSVTAHCKVVENLLKKLGTTDYAFADFLARLLTYDPSVRLDAFQAARHPFLATECALGYFLPSKDMLQNTWRGSSYSPLILTPSTYLHRPKIDERIKTFRYSSLDLLRVGTKARVDVEEKVVKVFPFKHKEDSSLVQEPDVSHAKYVKESTVPSVVDSQKGTDGNSEDIEVEQRDSRQDESLRERTSDLLSSKIAFCARKGYRERKKAIEEMLATNTIVSLYPNLSSENKTGNEKRKVESRGKKKHVLSNSSHEDVSVKRHCQPEKKRKKSSNSDNDLPRTRSRKTSKREVQECMLRKELVKGELSTSSPGSCEPRADNDGLSRTHSKERQPKHVQESVLRKEQLVKGALSTSSPGSCEPRADNNGLTRTHSKERQPSKHVQESVLRKELVKGKLSTSTPDSCEPPGADSQVIEVSGHLKLMHKDKDMQRKLPPRHPSSSLGKDISESCRTDTVLSKSFNLSPQVSTDDDDDYENCEVLLL